MEEDLKNELSYRVVKDDSLKRPQKQDRCSEEGRLFEQKGNIVFNEEPTNNIQMQKSPIFSTSKYFNRVCLELRSNGSSHCIGSLNPRKGIANYVNNIVRGRWESPINRQQYRCRRHGTIIALTLCL